MNNNQEEQRIQRIIYSPLNSNDQQVFYQVQQSPQQIFYQIQSQRGDQTTVSSQQNSREISNQNQQQHKIMIPKVVVQRNGSSEIIQMDHQSPHQTIQYNFVPQIDQNQQQHLIIQQQPQMKQTMYPSQGQQQQVIMPQYYQASQQQQEIGNLVQHHGGKIVMQTSNPTLQKIFFRPQQTQQHQQPIHQLIQNQSQIVHINQQQSSITNSPKIIPRLIPTNPNITRLRLPASATQQPKVFQLNASSRMRSSLGTTTVSSPRTAIIRSASPQSNVQPRSITPGKTIYILQQQPSDVNQIVNHQNSPVVRIPCQPKLTPTRTINIQQSLQQQVADNTGGTPITSSTSTFTMKKGSDCDDLEDSITATAISKTTREPPPLVQCPPQRQNQQNGKIQGLLRSSIANNDVSLMKSSTKTSFQVIRTGNPQSINLQTRSITTQPHERESAKMLVMLSNGEQRLITFTLPKESCTVQELLDQVGINVGADSIECIENHDSEIDYVVKIGNIASKIDTFDMAKAAENAENHIKQRQQQQMTQQRKIVTNVKESQNIGKSEIKPPPKFIEGFLAVCKFCGFSGNDHAKCERCNRVFSEEPKRTPASQKSEGSTQQPQSHTPIKISSSKLLNIRKNHMEELQKQHQINMANKQRVGNGKNVASTPVTTRAKIIRTKKLAIPEIVTLSSDDESESDSNQTSSQTKPVNTILKKSFEPEILEDLVQENFVRRNVIEFEEGEQKIQASFLCRSIRIGSYKFESQEKITMTTKGIRLVAPSVKCQEDAIILNIQHSEVVKVVVHFSKQLCVIFLYNKPSCARYITEQLSMDTPNERNFIYQPTAREEQYRKIVLLIDQMPEDVKSMILSIYMRPVLEEITYKDANDLLMKSSGFKLEPNSNVETDEKNLSQEIDIKKLFIYPPGRGGILITTNDYLCLGTDQYLNDVIIDFYLKYILNEILSEDQKSRVHIFSQFFYKRLTTMTREKDQKLTASEKRWKRVSSWTKNVNIFEKDFIVVPINEQSHWFLAIICFPSLKEPRTMDSDQPIKLLPMSKKKKLSETKAPSPLVKIGNTTITPLLKKEETVQIADDGSERDEAEGDESDLDETNETDEEVVDKGQPVKVPCILIFDSLIGAPRSRVVATLRDYLTCEYKAKFPELPPRSFTKDNLFGSQVKVPQQNNFTDCGLFLLQYVEHFFKDPIKDFRIPIKVLANWFNHDIVTRKREEIANLIREISDRENPDGVQLPEIEFPSKDGLILEQSTLKPADNAFGDSENIINSEDAIKNPPPPVQVKRVYVPRKRGSMETVANRTTEDNGSGTPNAKTPRLSATKQ